MAINTKPTPGQIKKHPREFALYCQAIHGKGKLDVKELHDLAAKYGDPSHVENIDKAEGEVDFAKIVEALRAPPSKEFEGVPMTKDYQDGSPAIGYANASGDEPLKPFKFTRRQTGPTDVHLQITHCGICHSDLHTAKNEWGATVYPCLPGHEMVGIVTEVGAEVTQFKVGDRAGVGCMVDSCLDCSSCNADSQQYCQNGWIQTYNSQVDGHTTKGGYSDHVVVREEFMLHVPDNLSMAGTAPLLCAGITVYSPLKHYGLDKPGMKVGVVGLGGVGHAAVLIGKAMGLEITVLSTTASKKEEALKNLGADHFVVSKNKEEMEAIAGSLDGIIDTISAPHPLPDFLALLGLDGKLVVLGVPSEPLQLPTPSLIFGRKVVGGSLIGGVRQTQEMLDFCGKHNITAIIEEVKASEINKAYDRMFKSDVRYRFVIDIQGSLVQ